LVIIFNASLVINIKFSVQYTMLNLIINLFIFVFIVVLHSCSSFMFMVSRRSVHPLHRCPGDLPSSPRVHRFLASPLVPPPARCLPPASLVEVGGRLTVDQQARCSSAPRESTSGSASHLPILCGTTRRGSSSMKALLRGDHRRQELSGN
jgi:hypothetical protein